jgi:hypothetical protein
MFLGREKTSGLVIKKNREVIEHYSVTLSVGSHLLAPYGFWKHTNNETGKESIFLILQIIIFWKVLITIIYVLE